MNTQLKLKFYYEHVLGTVYAEGDSPFHRTITEDVVTRFIDPLDLPKTNVIRDLGCGPGYFLDLMGARGFTNVRGITLSAEDLALCANKGHQDLVRGDMNFLSDADESVDLLFCRHSLEHSPFPYITLIEYNRVLKPGGVLYVEVPAPDCELAHEKNRNHFSIMGRQMWLSLLERTGFDVEWHEYEFPLQFEDDRGTAKEQYYIFVCRRRRPMDIK
jgi:SAM-dependent methyltransferase